MSKSNFEKGLDLRRKMFGPEGAELQVDNATPYLAPMPFRGKRNEPAYTAHTAQVGAEVFGMDYADFAAQTEANFERLFTKAVHKAAAA